MQFSFKPLLPTSAGALLALTVLGLVAARPAAAQYLDLGQGSATVVNDNGMSGTYLDSNNYSFSAGASEATYDYNVINVHTFDSTSVLTLETGSSAKTVYDYYSGTVNVNGGSVGAVNNGGVTVNLTDGSITSVLGGGYVNVSGGSLGSISNEFLVNVTGGAVSDLASAGNVIVGGGAVTTLLNTGADGSAVIGGGSVGTITDGDGATTTVLGGTVDTIESQPYYGILRTITVAGGSVGSVDNGFNGTLLLTGGSIGTVTNEGGSFSNDPFIKAGVLQASGGSVGLLDNYGIADITGGQFSFIDNRFGGIVNVYGFDLALSSGMITGSLQDGELIDTSYVDFGGQLNLFNTPVPEASTTVSLGLLLALGLGGVVMAAKRKKATGERSA